MKAALGFVAWIGGLVLAGRRYTACRAEGVLAPDCDQSLEYLGWGIALFGFIMLGRELRKYPLVERWIGD